MNVLERNFPATIATLGVRMRRLETVIDNLSHGVCYFDAEERLILSNRRYAEIYRLDPTEIRPGATVTEIVELRAAAGTTTMATDAYLANARAIQSSDVQGTWIDELPDGRAIQVYYRPTPDGGWVVTHEDITELKATRTVANERLSLQTLIDWVPDYLWVKDATSRFVVANKAITSDSGLANTSDMIGLTDFDIHASEAAQKFRTIEEDILRSGQPMIDREELILTSSGTEKWLLTTKMPLRNDLMEIIGLVGISRDITARKLADALREGLAQILEMIATSAPLEQVLARLIKLVDSQLIGVCGVVLLQDHKESRLRGMAPSLAEAYAKAIDPNDGRGSAAVFSQEAIIITEMTHDPLWEKYCDLAAAHGYPSCQSTSILSHEGAVLGTFALYSAREGAQSEAETRLTDVATRIASIAIQRKRAEDRIQFMANHDALTGLPNRTLLEDRLSQALLYAQRYDRWATVVFIDLDNLKIVNDSLGHNCGDQLLKTVASRMVDCVRATDTVVRFGGDEFVVLLPDQPKDTDALAVAIQKLASAIGKPLKLAGHELSITTSMGIANYPDDGLDADVLMANADAAMYRAKESGRNSFRFYTPELNIKAHEKFLLQKQLREAVERSEFVLFYQPQVDLQSERIFGVEALLRWKHPSLGMLPPMEFIPMAEETGLIAMIGEWVLGEACRQNKAWQDAGLPFISVAVNVSARQFRDKSLVAKVVNALQENGLAPKYLELELTESLIMQDLTRALTTMKQLQELGIQLSIDDFGTGYTRLSALTTFPVARLKIDKSFIHGLQDNENDKAIVSALISLGQKLNLRVVAEGVESDEQIAFLRANNCDEMQGYHFAKPMPAEAISDLLAIKPRSGG